MKILQRVINTATKPKTEWPIIAEESATVGTLMTGFVVPLAAIAPICGFLQALIFTSGLGIGPSVGLSFFAMIVGYLLALAGVYLTAFIVYKLAPTFQSSGDMAQALKIVAYAQAPYWVAGVLSLVPFLGILTIFVGLYGLYLAYLGLPPVMKTPPDKAIPYLVVVIVISILIWIVIGAITAGIVGMGLLTGGGI